MSFLKRILGGGAQAQRAELTVTWFNRIRDDAVTQVVGEAYRQSSVLSARPPTGADLPGGMPPPPPGYYKAMLTPEPTNQYDRNAVQVLLWAGRAWTLAGYIERNLAAEFQPLFRFIGREGGRPGIACDAALVNERGGTGVVLHLGTVAECMADYVTQDIGSSKHEWRGQLVAFTGRGGTLLGDVPLDRLAQQYLAEWAGCTFVERMSKKVQLLVESPTGEGSGNRLKAQEYGTPVVSEAAFLVSIGIPAHLVSTNSHRWAQG